MTNTEKVHPALITRYELRRNELFTLARIADLASRYGVMRVGKFTPGGEGVYAEVYVVRDLGRELVVHTAALVDDSLSADYDLLFYAGTYFERADIEMATAHMHARS